MPGPSLEDELFGAPEEKPLEDELFEATPLLKEGAAVSPAMEEAAQYEPAPEPEHVPVSEVKERAIGDEPWYARFVDSFSPRADESRVPLASIAENLVPLNLGDEASAAAFSPKNDPRDRMKFGPPLEQTPNEYAAGSQFEDNRRTLEAEKAQRDEEALPGTVMAGQLGAGALEAAALPATGVAAGLTGAGLTAANYMGQGSGDLSERAGQAVEMAKEHPFATAAGTLLPAVVGATGKGAAKWAPELADKAAINRTAAIMTPAQRSAHMDNFGGKAGLIKLGNEMEAAGLSSKQGSKWWPGNWLPASAEDVHANATNLRQNAGQRLGTAEDAITGVNPEIEVGSIARDLRTGADNLKGSWRSTAPAEAAERRRMAGMIDEGATQLPGIPGPEPVKPVARGPEGPWTPEQPAMPAMTASPQEWADYLNKVKGLPEGAQLPPAPIERPATPAVPSMPPAGTQGVTDREWHDYLLAKEQFENPTPISSGKMPFSDAVRQRRELDQDINFTKAGGVENAGVKEQVARQTGTALRQNIRSGLDDAAKANPVLEQPVADWNKANKDFSLASTVEDPAQLAMLKEYGGNLGLRDMGTAAMAHAMGLPGPLAAGAAAAMKGGRGANAMAGIQRNLSKALGAYGTGAGPVTLASTQAALPDPEVQRQKNQSLKDKLTEAAQGGLNWFSSLLE